MSEQFTCMICDRFLLFHQFFLWFDRADLVFPFRTGNYQTTLETALLYFFKEICLAAWALFFSCRSLTSFFCSANSLFWDNRLNTAFRIALRTALVSNQSGFDSPFTFTLDLSALLEHFFYPFFLLSTQNSHHPTQVDFLQFSMDSSFIAHVSNTIFWLLLCT